MSDNTGLPQNVSPPINQAGLFGIDWYLFFKGLVYPQAEATITVSASPYSYKATSKGNMLVKGGTVSVISVTRNSAYTTGLTAGFIPLSTGDTLTATYSGSLPTLVWFPS